MRIVADEARFARGLVAGAARVHDVEPVQVLADFLAIDDLVVAEASLGALDVFLEHRGVMTLEAQGVSVGLFA